MLQMFYLSIMAGALFLFFVIPCWGGHINAGNTSRRAGSIVGSTLDRVEEVEKMSLTCFSTTDPHSVDVNHIYDGLVDTGFLWRGEPSDILLCYNTSTPASSRCVPCILDLNKTVLAVCKGISETVQLMMETQGEHIIDNIKTDCPSFTKPAVPVPPLSPTLDAAPMQAIEPPGKETEVSTAGQVPWWGWLIVTLGIIMVFPSVLVYRKRQSIRKFVHSKFFTPGVSPAGDQDRPMGAVSEASPMNGVSVDKHQSLNEVDGTSTALM